jgi:hypothetical protein
MDGVSELAKMFKEREPIRYRGPIVGTVLSPPPEIKIQIDKNIILDKGHLVICGSILDGYERTYEVQGNVKFNDSNCGNTNSVNDGGYQASGHSHTIESVNINTQYTADGQIKTTDTLKEGDKVILIPSQDEQTYFLIDWAVRL